MAMRVFIVSDVHTDHPENMIAVASLSIHEYREDALILAGDVSHDLRVVRRTLELLLERFREVFFVPGNHELWVRKGEHEDSLQKFYDVLKLCDSLGVHTSPKGLGDGRDRVYVVPLFSWYTRPEEGADSLFLEKPSEDAGRSMWVDDYMVKWPSRPQFNPAGFFADLNETRVDAPYDAQTISFSHFLPRQDLIFAEPGEAVDPAAETDDPSFNFSRVAGSRRIEQQIRRLGPRIHGYGHQHRDRCRWYDGIWYVSRCLGYRKEREARMALADQSLVRPVWPMRESGLCRGGSSS